MNEVVSSFKAELSDLTVEFECLPIESCINSSHYSLNSKEIKDIDERINNLQEQIDELNKDIEKYSYNGDTMDLLFATASGILTGVLDVFFVGELGIFKNASDIAKNNFSRDYANVQEDIDKFIISFAKKKGYKGNSLSGAIDSLEQKYPVAQDNAFSGRGISSPSLHHLDDLAHHPSILGLISAIIVQFFRISVFSNKNGDISFVFVETSPKELKETLVPVVFSGIIIWMVNLAEKEYVTYDKELPKPVRLLIDNLHKAPIVIKVLKTILNWNGHLISDMNGSKSRAGVGAGIPGLFLSFFKELSMLPLLKDSDLPGIVNDLYHNNKKSPLTSKLDLRTEQTILKEQALPVILNEIIVRTGYFIRHLITESKNKDIKDIEWARVLPLGHRTIVRMMTVATGAFMAVDWADAAIRAAISSSGTAPAFFANFVLRVNFVGTGRFIVAIGSDLNMGHKKMGLEAQKSGIKTQILFYKEAKDFYKIDDSMKKSLEAEIAIYDLVDRVIQIDEECRTMLSDMDESSVNIISHQDDFVKNNKDTASSLLNILSGV